MAISFIVFHIFRIEKYLESVFKSLNVTYKGLESRLKAEGFKARVLQVLKAWEEWLVYHREFILKLRATFLGIQLSEKQAEPEPVASVSGDEKDDEDLDGVPLDGATLLKSAFMRGIPGATQPIDSPRMDTNRAHQDVDYDDDIDGVPRE